MKYIFTAFLLFIFLSFTNCSSNIGDKYIGKWEGSDYKDSIYLVIEENEKDNYLVKMQKDGIEGYTKIDESNIIPFKNNCLTRMAGRWQETICYNEKIDKLELTNVGLFTHNIVLHRVN